MKPIICPTCKQDLREPPHKGYGDCAQCGQGINWEKRQRIEARARKVVARLDKKAAPPPPAGPGDGG